jgi:dephospho-CoA kinase
MPLIIGVAGSIAAGKSSACALMVELGALHCDADKLVHRLYDPGTPAFDRIVGLFGREIVGADGFIDRRVLGAKVFGRPEAMKTLTAAIGNISKAVRGVIETWNASLPRSAVALLEAVNLIEAGYGRWCHQTWLVACSHDVARQRLMARNRFTPEEADQRLASQRPWTERAPAADVVLHNDGLQATFEARVREEFRRVRELWDTGQLPPSKYPEWWKISRQSRN